MAKKKGKREEGFTFPEFDKEEFRQKELRDSKVILFAVFYYIFKLLPLSVARKLGVSITTSLGPLFSINKLVKKNLRIAFKDQDEKWINTKAKKVWENLGYTIAEYSHLKKILVSNSSFKLTGIEGRPCLILLATFLILSFKFLF